MKFEHRMIQDLMPLCIDGAASEESRAAVKAHVAECEECAAVWAKMQPEITAFSAPPQPADPETARYTALADRVRGKKRRSRLLTVCAVLLIAAGGWFCTLLHFGFRLSPDAAVEAMIHELDRKFSGNQMTPWRDPANTVEVYRTIRSNDGKYALTAAMEKSASGEPLVLYFAESDRKERYAPGLWSSTRFYSVLKNDGFPPVTAEFYGCPTAQYENPLWLICYVTDSAVQRIEMTAGGQTYRLEPENGIAMLDCSDYKYLPYSYNRLVENPTIVKGYAYDAAGNVLYVYQEVEEEENPLYTYPGEAKYPVMEWVPVGE